MFSVCFKQTENIHQKCYTFYSIITLKQTENIHQKCYTYYSIITRALFEIIKQRVPYLPQKSCFG